MNARTLTLTTQSGARVRIIVEGHAADQKTPPYVAIEFHQGTHFFDCPLKLASVRALRDQLDAAIRQASGEGEPQLPPPPPRPPPR